MKTRRQADPRAVARTLWGVLIVLASFADAQSPQRKWDLFAYGSSNRLWYAVTTPAGSGGPVHTFIRVREAQGKWEEAADFSARLTAFTEFDHRAVAALAGGEWKRIAPDQFNSGPPLPGGAEIIAFGADENSLWAIAAGGSTLATTAPTTGPTTSAIRLLHLWRLESFGWRDVAILPPEFNASDGRPAAIVLDRHQPVIAVRRSDPHLAMVETWTGTTWRVDGELHADASIRKLSLLECDNRLVAWAAGESGAGTFFFPEKAGAWRAKPIAETGSVGISDVATASFRGELRLIAVSNDERFYEQHFDRDGQPGDSLRPLDEPENDTGVAAGNILTWAAVALIMIVSLATTTRGGVVNVAVVNRVRLPLAPLRLRLAAGLIDLLPCFLVPYVVLTHFSVNVKLSQLIGEAFPYRTALATLGLYFAHTVVAEIGWGRSIGKMFVGLRVLGIDGQKPSIASIILRNLIRLVEVPIVAPLLMIFLSPLHQRFGDFFASTVVTMKLPREVQEKLD